MWDVACHRCRDLFPRFARSHQLAFSHHVRSPPLTVRQVTLCAHLSAYGRPPLKPTAGTIPPATFLHTDRSLFAGRMLRSVFRASLVESGGTLGCDAMASSDRSSRQELAHGVPQPIAPPARRLACTPPARNSHIGDVHQRVVRDHQVATRISDRELSAVGEDEDARRVGALRVSEQVDRSVDRDHSMATLLQIAGHSTLPASNLQGPPTRSRHHLVEEGIPILPVSVMAWRARPAHPVPRLSVPVVFLVHRGYRRRGHRARRKELPSH
jgi:hypothetical protein